MLRIAVVDDNPQDAESLQESLGEYFASHSKETEILIYHKGDEFLSAFHSDFDIIFLDVEMPGIDGFMVAEKIRQTDQKTLIIFQTNMSQLARQGYRYAAFDYIVKPLIANDLALTLDRALANLASKTDRVVLLLDENKRKTAVGISEIAYLDVNGHYITFHTTKGNFSQYGVFKVVLEELDLPEYFAKCNNCYVVNYRFIDKVFADSLLVNGDTLAISRSQKRQFLAGYMAFISGRGI